jgi:hypothetical protein
MRKLLLLALIGGFGAGAFFAFRWFRGDTAYEEAVQALDHEPQGEPLPDTEPAQA